MSKTYQIKMTAPKVEAKTLDATPGTGKAPITLKAEPGARYHLTDTRSGFAPDNIRISRSGKNLKIFTEGVSEPTFIVEDFYEQPADKRAALTGKSEDGNNYEYIPENASGTAAAPVLKDDGQIFGMALGGEVINAGAAVGLLAPVAAFNPLLLAGGALGAAAAGGGGGGDGGSTASTVYAKLGSEDTGPQGDNITSDQTPSIVGKATPKSTVTVTVNDKEYTGTADDSGNFEIQIPDTDKLPQGRYVPKVVAKLNGATTNTFDGTPFIIDLSSANNIDNADGADPAGKTDTNSSIAPSIDSISTDSADPKDFYTNKGGNNGLKFVGTAKGLAIDSQDWIELLLTKTDGTVLKEYVKPDTSGKWSWDKLSTLLADGQYTLSAQVVDGAGNAVGDPTSQLIHIDTSTSDNTNGKDPNADLTLDITGLVLSTKGERTGLADFYNNAPDKSKFKGTFSKEWVNNNDRLVLEIFDPKTGKLLAAETITPTGNAWTSSDTFLGNRANGTYVLRATVEDQAGNTVMVDTQSFVIDSDPINTSRIQFDAADSSVVVTLPEGGQFTITGSKTGKYTYDYSGADLDLQQKLSSEAFTYTFTDYAGNVYFDGSTGTSPWSGPVRIKADTSISAASAKTALTGDIGTYLLTANVDTLDLSTVISNKGTDAFNSIDLTGKGITTLTIKAHDLLDIGLTNCFVTGINSFSKDQNYDSDIQFKVKGDSTDILKMTELTATGNKVMLSDGLSYAVYHTAVGSIDIDVFVLDVMKVN